MTGLFLMVAEWKKVCREGEGRRRDSTVDDQRQRWDKGRTDGPQEPQDYTQRQ